jgi:hypothetical protein
MWDVLEKNIDKKIWQCGLKFFMNKEEILEKTGRRIRIRTFMSRRF